MIQEMDCDIVVFIVQLNWAPFLGLLIAGLSCVLSKPERSVDLVKSMWICDVLGVGQFAREKNTSRAKILSRLKIREPFPYVWQSRLHSDHKVNHFEVFYSHPRALCSVGLAYLLSATTSRTFISEQIRHQQSAFDKLASATSKKPNRLLSQLKGQKCQTMAHQTVRPTLSFVKVQNFKWIDFTADLAQGHKCRTMAHQSDSTYIATSRGFHVLLFKGDAWFRSSFPRWISLQAHRKVLTRNGK